MCEKCISINNAIERYRRIIIFVGDDLTIDHAKNLIGELEAQKAAFHPKHIENS